MELKRTRKYLIYKYRWIPFCVEVSRDRIRYFFLHLVSRLYFDRIKFNIVDVEENEFKLKLTSRASSGNVLLNLLRYIDNFFAMDKTEMLKNLLSRMHFSLSFFFLPFFKNTDFLHCLEKSSWFNINFYDSKYLFIFFSPVAVHFFSKN